MNPICFCTWGNFAPKSGARWSRSYKFYKWTSTVLYFTFITRRRWIRNLYHETNGWKFPHSREIPIINCKHGHLYGLTSRGMGQKDKLGSSNLPCLCSNVPKERHHSSSNCTFQRNFCYSKWSLETNGNQMKIVCVFRSWSLSCVEQNFSSSFVLLFHSAFSFFVFYSSLSSAFILWPKLIG